MRSFLLFIGAIILVSSMYFVFGKHVCECGCPNCGPSCVNQCDGTRCIIGEKCCPSCTFKK